MAVVKIRHPLPQSREPVSDQLRLSEAPEPAELLEGDGADWLVFSL